MSAGNILLRIDRALPVPKRFTVNHVRRGRPKLRTGTGN